MAAIIETGRKRRTRGRYLLCCCCTSEGSSLGLTSKAAALPANASAAAPQPSSTLYAAYVDRCATPHATVLGKLEYQSTETTTPSHPAAGPHVAVRQSLFRSRRRAVIAATAVYAYNVYVYSRRFWPDHRNRQWERAARAGDHKQSRILINLVRTWLSNVKTSSAAAVSLASIGRASPRKPKSVNPVETFDESPRRSN